MNNLKINDQSKDIPTLFFNTIRLIIIYAKKIIFKSHVRELIF